MATEIDIYRKRLFFYNLRFLLHILITKFVVFETNSFVNYKKYNYYVLCPIFRWHFAKRHTTIVQELGKKLSLPSLQSRRQPPVLTFSSFPMKNQPFNSSRARGIFFQYHLNVVSISFAFENMYQDHVQLVCEYPVFVYGPLYNELPVLE